MPIFGTIVSGQVQLDHPADLPDGSRVTLWTDQEEDAYFGQPVEVASSDQLMASLRESIDETASGLSGYSVEDAFKILDADMRNSTVNQS